MLCGVSRLSPRSLLATATFFLTAVLTARFFPAPLHESASVSAAYTPTYPSKASLAVLGGTVVLAALARQAIAALVPRAMKYLRSRSADEPQTEAVAPPSTAAEHALASVPYFTSGLTFSLGLAASGMIDPLKVLGFLRLPPPAESFDPSLAMVVLGGLIPNAIHWVLASRNPKPHLAWEKWQVPSRTDFDWRLVTGAAAFGAGWGLAGVCPGPAIETAGSLVAAAVQGVDVSVAAQGWAAYFANLLLGMGAVRVLEAAL
jgi:uncharacterized membrane protein YedE/YeeE